jgi:hypothetical protein
MNTDKYSVLPKSLTVFFAAEGISMSEANHTANMINQINTAISARIINNNAVNEVITYEGNKVNILKGVKDDELLSLCQKEGELFGLSAWLREAVKAKDTLLNVVRTCDEKELMVEEGDIIPEFDIEQPKIERVKQPKNITESDVLGTFTIAERAEYFETEAIAAHIGKKIHANGKINEMRNEILNFTPFRMHTFNGDHGKKDIPVERTLAYNADEINKIYFTLQTKHRDVESKLNWFKARIKNEINSMQAAENKAYTLAVGEIAKKYELEAVEFNAARKKYINDLQTMNARAAERRVLLTNEISKLKVVIPNRFDTLLEYVQTYNG